MNFKAATFSIFVAALALLGACQSPSEPPSAPGDSLPEQEPSNVPDTPAEPGDPPESPADPLTPEDSPQGEPSS